MPGCERAQDDAGPPLAQPHPEPESLDPVEVAVDVDLLAGQAGPQQRYVLAHPGERAIAVRHAVPALGHDRRRDADAEQDVAVGVQRLQRGAGHGDDHRRAELQREHAGAEVEPGGGGAGRGQDRERLGPRGLRGPEARVAEVGRRPGGRHRQVGAECHQRCERDAGALDAHGPPF